jgi:5,10-methylenetetrahydromethanopterin reductase
MAIEISAGILPGKNAPRLAKLAEELGYRRVWVYDSPALFGDLWMTLARIADATDHIGLGTGVMVPHLRHVMVTASALASLEELAPGRSIVAIGTGFTARMTFGDKALSWNYVSNYIRALKGLLRGETVAYNGKKLRMIHPEGCAPPRAIEIPILVGANGPKGLAVAREFGDGVMSVGAPQPGFAHSAMLQTGTLLREGEDFSTPRVIDALGPTAAAGYHAVYESAGAAAVDALPNGKAWREEIERFPEDERHLAIHEGHFVRLSEIDRRHVSLALAAGGLVGTPEQIREKVAALEAGGCTEIFYGPIGDIEHELDAMARVLIH